MVSPAPAFGVGRIFFGFYIDGNLPVLLVYVQKLV
jgi:hypothetical protein